MEGNMAKTNDQIKQALREPTPQDRIKWRVGFKNMDKGYAMMLAYIDARYVQDRLDDVVGSENWSVNYNKIDNSLFCAITVTFPNGEMVTKSDCGTETDVEAEKGQASDAFKRAGVMFGICRDLYDLGDHYADLNSNGYGDKNWKPQGWGETPQRHVQTDEDSAVPTPTTSQPEVTKTTQEIADDVIERAIENAPDGEDGEIETIAVNEKPLKEGKPPEDEWVSVKNLHHQATSKKGAMLLLPDDFDMKDKDDYGKTEKYWVGKQFVKTSGDQMNGKTQAVITRWIAEEKGYKFEELKSKDDDLPF